MIGSNNYDVCTQYCDASIVISQTVTWYLYNWTNENLIIRSSNFICMLHILHPQHREPILLKQLKIYNINKDAS